MLHSWFSFCLKLGGRSVRFKLEFHTPCIYSFEFHHHHKITRDFKNGLKISKASYVAPLVAHCPRMKNNLIVAAAAANNVLLLKHFHETFNLFLCPKKLLNVASFSGSLEALVYLHE
ncbi:hypothetical protein Ae201684P_019372 [Aphanomyces euteiches]|uniref:Uncharacterized protein n=1 Tax=Aphanomyces euteiches TaxID=100861 RepID=A0A6G0XEJ1_9STRA|nr:hypothetical protein Ae201684_005587 [Aphanomyces euteiches]KAH9078281.1 hypothetical protein Ae201684P_019372 [Aphanomyces euteiches]